MLIFNSPFLDLHHEAKASGAPTGTIGPLFLVTFEAILEVFIMCMIGFILAKKGIIDSKTKKQLNRLNVSLFTPALLFSKVAFTLTPAKLAELYIVPIGFIIVSGVSALIAWGMGYLFRLSKSQRAFAVACSMFMNSNSLPIALMQSLTATVPGLKWGHGDTRDAMLGRGLTYLVLYSTLGIILRWSYGVRLLSVADDEAASTKSSDTPITSPAIPEEEQTGPAMLDVESGTAENSPLLSHRKSTLSKGHHRRNISKDSVAFAQYDEEITEGRPKKPSNKRTRSNVFHSFPNTPTRTPAISQAGDEGSSDEDETASPESDDEWGSTRHNKSATEPSSNKYQSAWRRTKSKLNKWIGKPIARSAKGFVDFMTAPLWAALASLIVACIQPLQHLMGEHLTPVKGVLKNAGNCSVPITLLVLGAYFVRDEKPPTSSGASTPRIPLTQRKSFRPAQHPLDSANWRSSRFRKILSSVSFNTLGGYPDREQTAEEKRQSRQEWRCVMVAVLSRMIIAPLILLPALAYWAKVTVNIADDPVFIVTAVLVIGSPPAITLAQIVSATGDTFERLISKTLLISYAIFTPPTTIALVLLGLLIDEMQRAH